MKKCFFYKILFSLFFLLSFSLAHSTVSEKQKKDSVLFPSFTFDEKGKIEGGQALKDSVDAVENKEEGKEGVEKKSASPVSSKNFLGLKEKSWVTQRHFLRMLMGLCLIVGFGSLFFILSYLWKRKFQTTVDHKKMRIITQFYLGSKKKLIILRVAGEYLLLGVTDHNISLIKTLSLLDEDSSLEPEENFSENLLKHQDQKDRTLESSLESSIHNKDFIEKKEPKKKFEDQMSGSNRSRKIASLEEIRSLLENQLRNKKKIS